MTNTPTHETTELSERWEPLGEVVRSQMIRLGVDQNELARRSDVSRPVITDLRRGTAKRYRTDTLLRVSRGLDLHPFALIAVLAGEEAADSCGLPGTAPPAATADREPIREVA